MREPAAAGRPSMRRAAPLEPCSRCGRHRMRAQASRGRERCRAVGSLCVSVVVGPCSGICAGQQPPGGLRDPVATSAGRQSMRVATLLVMSSARERREPREAVASAAYARRPERSGRQLMRALTRHDCLGLHGLLVVGRLCAAHWLADALPQHLKPGSGRLSSQRLHHLV